MSDIRKFMDIMMETTAGATSSGSVATVAQPMMATERRINPSVYANQGSKPAKMDDHCPECKCNPCECHEESRKAPDAPKAKEFGLWQNSVLAGKEQKSKKTKKKTNESFDYNDMIDDDLEEDQGDINPIGKCNEGAGTQPQTVSPNAAIVNRLVNPEARQRFLKQHSDTTAQLSDPKYDHNPDALAQHAAYPKQERDEWIQNVRNANQFDNPHQITRIALNKAGLTPDEVLQNLPKGYNLPSDEPKSEPVRLPMDAGYQAPVNEFKKSSRSVNERDFGSGQRQLELKETRKDDEDDEGLDPESLKNHKTIRRGIEKMSARHAGENYTPAQMAALRKRLDAAGAAADEKETARKARIDKPYSEYAPDFKKDVAEDQHLEEARVITPWEVEYRKTANGQNGHFYVIKPREVYKNARGKSTFDNERTAQDMADFLNRGGEGDSFYDRPVNVAETSVKGKKRKDDIEEGLRNKLAGAALVGAMAFGGGAQAQGDMNYKEVVQQIQSGKIQNAEDLLSLIRNAKNLQMVWKRLQIEAGVYGKGATNDTAGINQVIKAISNNSSQGNNKR